ncbi:penicillin-binding protein [Anaerosacchariphilus sp. NSJ-68]|uniref:Penicillin-binding protein n=2 Tax=Lachnospiraceae TaxID=186803 RepID=A0A923LDA4_9FIRM|nr:penicillin-binding protein [Anaerosacchariphilus hominis]MBC5699326.1 penicillin-binding protein [Roseburia difficilis]
MFREFRDTLWNLIKSRTFILSVGFLVLFGILLQRVFYLQIVKGSDYLESFSLKTERDVSLSSTRGKIYDRNGEVLAYSELSYSVTIQDNGSYANKSTKNARLNETIYRLIQLVENNGDSVVNDLGIVYENGNYAYTLEGRALLRLKADIYGKNKTSELTPSQELASANELMKYLCEAKKYNIPDSYTEAEKTKYGIAVDGYTPEQKLQIATIRYGMDANSYKRYVATTVATDVSEETVAAVLENQDSLQGAEVAESSRRVYPDSVYFSSIIGYIGKASQDELESLQEKNEDYELNDIVGKAGIEQYMETELQGTKGYEKMYVDSVGRIIEVAEQKEPVPGNDVYLTIDKNLQIACYNILEQKLAGILISKIQNTKEYNPGPNPSAAKIMIPIYDVYYALIDNHIIDITHFGADDATELEKSVSQRFQTKREQAVAAIMAQLNSDSATAYQNLSREMKNYMSYIVANVLMGDNQVLMKSEVDTSDATYIAWTNDETISLREYLQYAISQNWIDVTKISGDNPYLDSQEIYQSVLDYIQSALMEDMEFGKMLYKYMLLDDQMSGREICLLLYDQNVLEYDEDTISRLNSGALSSYSFMIDKIQKLEITPAQLALEPCSGGIIIVDADTGDTLASVTYPSYDNNRLTNVMDSNYYNSLQKDLSSPFVNRVTQENLAPGSTFKPITAIAGLEEGAITPSTVIYASGQFTEITPSPTCWIFNQYGGHHGNETVVTAIRDSCNCFFYEVGYRLAGGRSAGGYNVEKGLSILEKYARMFGLGDKSGLELSEYEPRISDEDAVRSSIGQGTNSYSLSHIVRYVATLANRGSCYDLTLLDKLTETDGTLIEEYQPKLHNQVEIANSSWDAVHQGMRLVAENTSSLKVLSDLGLNVAGKTGTAQQSKSHPNHALFVGFAPYEQPEIAVAVRIANGYTSANCAEAASDVFKYYFKLTDEEEILSGTASGSSGQTIGD